MTGTFGKESSDVSSDGRWLAIVANPSGAYQVHVRSLSGSGAFRQISSGDVASIGGIILRYAILSAGASVATAIIGG